MFELEEEVSNRRMGKGKVTSTKIGGHVVSPGVCDALLSLLFAVYFISKLSFLFLFSKEL